MESHSDKDHLIQPGNDDGSGEQAQKIATVEQSYDLQMDQLQVLEEANKAKSTLKSGISASPQTTSNRYTNNPQQLQKSNDNNQSQNATLGTNFKPHQQRQSTEQELNRQQAENPPQNQQNQTTTSNEKELEVVQTGGDINQLNQQKDAERFFLTGVNVNKKSDTNNYEVTDLTHEDLNDMASATDQIMSGDGGVQGSGVDAEMANAEEVNRYKLVAVVDSSRTISNNECVYVSMKRNEVAHLAVNSHTILKHDELVSTYEQVFRIGSSLAHRFMTHRLENKIVMNVADQYATNNNCGFNLANFKPKFLEDYFQEVVADYERSFVGSFAGALLDKYLPESGFEAYVTVAKFEGNMGYSLTQNYEQTDIDVEFRGTSALNSDQVPTQGNSERQNSTQTPITTHHDTSTFMVPKMNQQEEGSKILNNQVQSLANQQLVMQPSTEQLNSHLNEIARKKEILKPGSIPEFVQISSVAELYQIFTEANLKNKLLMHNQEQQRLLAQKESGGASSGKQTADQKASGLGQFQDPQNIDLMNIKDDIAMIQFKIVKRNSAKTFNTITFVNVPMNKQSDPNIATMLDIVSKLNASSSQKIQDVQRGLRAKKTKKEQFLPYNKSILTRIVFPQLTKNNLLVINHYPKKTIKRYLSAQGTSGYQAGPGKGLFAPFFKLGFDSIPFKRLNKKKLSHQQSLKVLQRQFKDDLSVVYNELGEFREGLRNFEVYTEQTASLLSSCGMQGVGGLGGKGAPLTMFAQVISFLVLQDEMAQEAESVKANNDHNASASHPGLTALFPRILPQEEIQKVIFDTSYLNFIQRKQMADNYLNSQDLKMYQAEFANNLHKAQSSLYRQLSPAERRQEYHQQNNDQSPSQANTVSSKVSLHNQLNNPHQKQFQVYEAEKSRKVQNQLYVSAKNDLKNEYRKKMGFLHKRLSKKGTQIDPSQILMNSMTATDVPISAKNGQTFASTTGIGIVDRKNQRGLNSQSVGTTNRRRIGGGAGGAIGVNSMRNNQSNVASRESEFDFGALNDSSNNLNRKESENRGGLKKSEYFNFYLQNAQKAINMMIVQHKSQQNLSGSSAVGNGQLYSAAANSGGAEIHINRFNQKQPNTASNMQYSDHIIDMNLMQAQQFQDMQHVDSQLQDVSNTIYEHENCDTKNDNEENQNQQQLNYSSATQMMNKPNIDNNNETKMSYQSSFTNNAAANYSSHLDPIVNKHKRISRIAVKQHTKLLDPQASAAHTAETNKVVGGTRTKPFSAQTRHNGIAGQQYSRGGSKILPNTPQFNALNNRGVNGAATRSSGMSQPLAKGNSYGAKRGFSSTNATTRSSRGGKEGASNLRRKNQQVATHMIRSDDSSHKTTKNSNFLFGGQGQGQMNLDVTSAGNEEIDRPLNVSGQQVDEEEHMILGQSEDQQLHLKAAQNQQISSEYYEVVSNKTGAQNINHSSSLKPYLPPTQNAFKRPNTSGQISGGFRAASQGRAPRRMFKNEGKNQASQGEFEINNAKNGENEKHIQEVGEQEDAVYNIELTKQLSAQKQQQQSNKEKSNSKQIKKGAPDFYSNQNASAAAGISVMSAGSSQRPSTMGVNNTRKQKQTQGISGALLANGFKSLRAQGRIRIANLPPKPTNLTKKGPTAVNQKNALPVLVASPGQQSAEVTNICIENGQSNKKSDDQHYILDDKLESSKENLPANQLNKAYQQSPKQTTTSSTLSKIKTPQIGLALTQHQFQKLNVKSKRANEEEKSDILSSNNTATGGDVNRDDSQRLSKQSVSISQNMLSAMNQNDPKQRLTNKDLGVVNQSQQIVGKNQHSVTTATGKASQKINDSIDSQGLPKMVMVENNRTASQLTNQKLLDNTDDVPIMNTNVAENAIRTQESNISFK